MKVTNNTNSPAYNNVNFGKIRYVGVHQNALMELKATPFELTSKPLQIYTILTSALNNVDAVRFVAANRGRHPLCRIGNGDLYLSLVQKVALNDKSVSYALNGKPIVLADKNLDLFSWIAEFLKKLQDPEGYDKGYPPQAYQDFFIENFERGQDKLEAKFKFIHNTENVLQHVRQMDEDLRNMIRTYLRVA
jgi:hypothetical protein